MKLVSAAVNGALAGRLLRVLTCGLQYVWFR